MSHILHNFDITTEEISLRGQAKGFLKKALNDQYKDIIYEMWENNTSINDIAKSLNISIGRVKRILIKIFNIAPEKIKENGRIKNSNNKKIPIIQYDLNNNFIQKWASAQDAAKALNLDHSSIRKCVKG